MPDYSAGMISEFATLLEKIRQLSELTQALRVENAELRTALEVLTAEKSDLSARIHEAHTRVANLLETMPATLGNQEESA